MKGSFDLARERPAWHLLVPLGAAELALLTALGWAPNATFPWPGLVVFAGAFGAYALAAGRITRTSGGGALIWTFAIAMRLALVLLDPELSDDVYRYLWDGHVQLSGVNPYLYAPAAPELAELRTAYHGLINNPSIPTVYPPIAQFAFLFIALAGGTVLRAKLLWLALDLGTAWLLGKIARKTGRSVRLTQILYLWCPLLVVEVAWSGHLEPLGLFALALAILLARAPWCVGAATAIAALTKFAPAVAVPALIRRHGWRFLLGFAVTALIMYAPYALAGESLFTGLRTYSEHWWFMKGPFTLLELTFVDPIRARYAAGTIVVMAVAWASFQRYDTERTFLWVLGTGMVLTPTLHPWYVLWMLPMAALRASRSWILLSGLAFVGYYGLGSYQETGVWAQPPMARLIMWVPFLVLLVYDAFRPWQEPAESPDGVADGM